MATAEIEAIVEFGDGRLLSLNDLLSGVTHHQGFKLGTSYCLIEVFNPHVESMNDFQPGTTFTLTYGRDGFYSPKYMMEIYSVENIVAFSRVGFRILGVEPGFLRLIEQVRMHAYKDQTVSQVVTALAQEAKLRSKVTQTVGRSTYLQPNMDNYHFILKYLLPIAANSGGVSANSPYLCTIDNGTLHFRPPNLKQKPQFSFVLDPGNETLVKRFDIISDMRNDVTYGGELMAYGYDFVQKGLMRAKQTLEEVANKVRLNKVLPESTFTRQMMSSYSEQWQLQALAKNAMGRNQFALEVHVMLDGRPQYTYDTLMQFAIPEQGMQRLKEYSGNYYVFNTSHVIKLRTFFTHCTLFSNSVFLNKVVEMDDQSSGGNPTRESANHPTFVRVGSTTSGHPTYTSVGSRILR